MEQLKYLLSEKSFQALFQALIKMCVDIIMGVKDFIFSDYKITLIFLVILVVGLVSYLRSYLYWREWS